MIPIGTMVSVSHHLRPRHNHNLNLLPGVIGVIIYVYPGNPSWDGKPCTDFYEVLVSGSIQLIDGDLLILIDDD